jgi:uncharacterized glyoxalase superfamily protein PhnB
MRKKDIGALGVGVDPCDLRQEAHDVSRARAEGGQVQMPLGKTFFSPCFGMVSDKFGVGWMINVAN